MLGSAKTKFPRIALTSWVKVPSPFEEEGIFLSFWLGSPIDFSSEHFAWPFHGYPIWRYLARQNTRAKYAKDSNWRTYFGPSNMVEWGIPEKIMQNSVQMSWTLVKKTAQSKVINKSDFYRKEISRANLKNVTDIVHSVRTFFQLFVSG